MKTISMNAVAAAHEVASTIEGYGDPRGIVVTDGEASFQVLANRGYNSMRLATDDYRSAEVTVQRAEVNLRGALDPATVTWSSSSSDARGAEDAGATARLLVFATQVATTLQDWAARGDLNRINAEQMAAYGRELSDPSREV